jgi:hypothetical protein
MNGCQFGFHKWVYIREGKSRWCKGCQKKEEIGRAGKWVEGHSTNRPVDKTKYCECPRDYTIAIKLIICPRCGLPRRPVVLPVRSR